MTSSLTTGSLLTVDRSANRGELHEALALLGIGLKGSLEHLKFETGRVDDKGEETNVQELGACLIRVRVLRVTAACLSSIPTICLQLGFWVEALGRWSLGVVRVRLPEECSHG